MGELRGIGDTMKDVLERIEARQASGEVGGPDLAELQRQAMSPGAEAEWLREAGVPRRFREIAGFTELPPAVKTWAAGWRRGSSMVLAGPTGSGKTAASVAALTEAYRGCRMAEIGGRPVFRAPSAYFTTTHDLYEAVFRKAEGLLLRVRRVQILVLDDWGAAFEHSWPVTEIEALVNARWAATRSTIVTTNLPPEEFGERAGRSFDRLCDAEPGLVILDRPTRRGRCGL